MSKNRVEGPGQKAYNVMKSKVTELLEPTGKTSRLSIHF
jgi:hypothetical protein